MTTIPPRNLPRSGTAFSRTLVLLLGAAAAVIVVAGMRSLSGVFAPTFLALVLTICAHPLRMALTRRRVPNWLATLVVIVTVYVVLLTLVLCLLVSIARLAELLPQYQEDLKRLAEEAAGWLKSVGVGPEQVSAIAKAIDPREPIALVTGIFSGMVSVLSDLVFIIMLLLFLAVDGGSFAATLRALAPEHDNFARAMTTFAVGTRRYLVVSTVFGLIVALFDVALLYWLDIPAPWLWGVLAFITNYIPNIGFVIGLVPPTFLGLVEHGWGGALAVVVGYCILNVVIQSVIQPRFVGQAVGLSTSLTFLSLVFWAWVFGGLGALLAIPLSLLVRAVLIDADPANRWLIPLLSGTSAKPAEAEATADPPVQRDLSAGKP